MLLSYRRALSTPSKHCELIVNYNQETNNNYQMSVPQQSLRKHRQTLLPEAANNGSKKSYGEIDSFKGQLPAVALKDREKVGNLVKKRFSSRVQVDNVYAMGGELPPLPANASKMISESTRKVSAAEGQRASGQGQGLAVPSGAGNPSRSANPYADVNDSYASSYPAADESTGGDAPSSEVNHKHSPVSRTTDRRQHRTAPEFHSKSSIISARTDAFLDRNFDPKAYLAAECPGASEQELKEFNDDMNLRHKQLKIERRNALHNNYKAFLRVGSQVAGFVGELESVRRLISDLRDTTSAMIDDANVVLSSQTKKENGSDLNRSGSRNSVIMLERVWANELASLFKHVEGAQQYLPSIPGRHVVTESGGWYQLNAATWRPLQPAHIFLLNDHILIATKKRNAARGADHQVADRLIAENCWPLNDVTLIDISKEGQADPSRAQYTENSICLQHGSSSFVYRAENGSQHRKIIDQFARAKQDLSKLGVMGGRSHSRQSSGSGNIFGTGPGSRVASGAGTGAENGDRINDVTTTLQDLKEIDHAISDLDITIAYRKFDEAVDLIDSHLHGIRNGSYQTRGRSITGEIIIPSEVFKSKIEQRISEVSDLLLAELSQEYLSRSQIQKCVELLIKLDIEEQAKKTYLESRRSQLQRRSKQVEFHGDIINYIRQQAIIYFRMIASTVEIFLNCFKNPEHTSSVVHWTKEQVDAYSVLFSRQLYNVSQDTSTYRKCAEITRQQSSDLETLGLDFGFRLSFLYPSQQSSVKSAGSARGGAADELM